jgi:hypothetical protein
MARPFQTPRLYLVRPVSADDILAHAEIVRRRKDALRQAEAARDAALARYSTQHGYRVTLSADQGLSLAKRERGL